MTTFLDVKQRVNRNRLPGELLRVPRMRVVVVAEDTTKSRLYRPCSSNVDALHAERNEAPSLASTEARGDRQPMPPSTSRGTRMHFHRASHRSSITIKTSRSRQELPDQWVPKQRSELPSSSANALREGTVGDLHQPYGSNS